MNETSPLAREQPAGQLDVSLRHRATMLTAAGPDTPGVEWGWEEWEDLDYYEDLECAKSNTMIVDIR